MQAILQGFSSKTPFVVKYDSTECSRKETNPMITVFLFDFHVVYSNIQKRSVTSFDYFSYSLNGVILFPLGILTTLLFVFNAGVLFM